MRPLSAAILCASASLWLVDAAQAITSYGAELDAQLTITGFFDAGGVPIARPAELVIEGEAALFDRFTSSTGSAAATANDTIAVLAADPMALAIGEGLVLGAAVSGDASTPGDESEALVATDGFLFFDNRSPTAAVRIDFELSYAWLLEAALDEPGSEQARADFTLMLVSDSGGTLFALFEETQAGLDPASRTDGGVFAGQLLLDPFEFDGLALVADASGAAAVVPEPGTVTPIVASLVAMAGLRRRLRGRSDR
jgi:hypothetical protein